VDAARQRLQAEDVVGCAVVMGVGVRAGAEEQEGKHTCGDGHVLSPFSMPVH
jgi:hypothetical protein